MRKFVPLALGDIAPPLGWRPVRKDNIGAQQLRYATSMNRGTLYFRLSLIWLAIVVAGVVYVLLQ